MTGTGKNFKAHSSKMIFVTKEIICHPSLHFKVITCEFVRLFDLILYITVINFSVMLGRVFLG